MHSKCPTDAKRVSQSYAMDLLRKCLFSVCIAPTLLTFLRPTDGGVWRTKRDSGFTPGYFNRFLDNALNDAQKGIADQGNIIEFPPFKYEISYDTWIGTLYASVSVYDGKVHNLQTVHRTGESEIIDETDDGFDVVLYAGVEEPTVTAGAMINLQGWEIPITVFAKYDRAWVKAVGHVYPDPKVIIRLISLTITDLDGFTTEIDGLGSVFEWLLEIIIELFHWVFNDWIKDTFGQIMQNFVMTQTG